VGSAYNDDVTTWRRAENTSRELAGVIAGSLGALAVAAVFVPLREHMHNANVALVLVLPVLAAAAIGGRWAGAIGALVAAMVFDFFFTVPYQSLKINDGGDVVTLVLLVVVALVAAEIGIRSRRVERTARAARSELQRLFRVAELAAHGGEREDVVSAVRAELIGMLELDDCTFAAAPNGARSGTPTAAPQLGRHGALEGTALRFDGDDFVLPREGVELPVVGGGRELGRLTLRPGEHSHASAEQRRVAVALADELGIVLAADSSTT
jgi:K+-sensing histidine kinase KdpD